MSTSLIRQMTFATVAVVAPVVFVFALASPGSAASTGEMVDLGTLGGNFSAATGINEKGEVVGGSDTAVNGVRHGFFWTPEQGMIDLGTLGGVWVEAKDLNDLGQVVGMSFTSKGLQEQHGFIWTLEEGMVDLGTLGGSHGGAVAINNAGEVAGTSSTANGDFHAYLWTAEDGMIDLATLGGAESRAWDINEAGEIIGMSFTAEGEEHAFFWSRETGMVDIGTLGGGAESTPWDINDSGQVVGDSFVAGWSDVEAFSWAIDEGIELLPRLEKEWGQAAAVNSDGLIAGDWFTPNTVDSKAVMWTGKREILDIAPESFSSSVTVGGINESGQVIGRHLECQHCPGIAFSWTRAGGLVDIGTLGGPSSFANGLNDLGQVVGVAETVDGERHAYVWTAGSSADGSGTFIDDDDSIFEADIEWLAAEGITKGCNPPANDLFCPADFVTRGQMAAFLHRALDDVLTPSQSVEFVDDDGNTFEADIEWLGGTGVTKGCNPPTNNRYCPNDFVTRGQMAAFLVRALGYTDNGGGNLFIDDDGNTFEADIDKLGTAGVTRGCNPPVNDRFCPDDFVTRGQMAAFLHRALGS